MGASAAVFPEIRGALNFAGVTVKIVHREYPERPIVGVGALIVDREAGRIVLVRRGSEPLKGKWSIPGGVLELGETLVAAVKRETLEETGLVVEPIEVAGVIDRIIPDADGRTQYHYVLVDYLCKPIAGQLRAGSDVDEALWVPKNELDAYDISDLTRQMIDKVLSKVR